MSSTSRTLADERLLETELLVDLVAADLGQVVALGVEVEVVEQRLRGLAGRRLARAQLAVDVEQRVVLAGGVVLLQGLAHRLELAELLEDLRLGPAERLEQHGDRLLALAVDADADHVALVDLELEPGAARGDDLRGVDVLVGGLVGGALEVDARRADELRHDDALGAVDDEGAALGHQREVAHEDRLALDLAGGRVHELGGHEERGGSRSCPAPCTRRSSTWRARTGGPGTTATSSRRSPRSGRSPRRSPPDRTSRGCGCRRSGLHPGLPALVAEEPVEAVGLQSEEVRDLKRFADLAETDTAGGRTSGGLSGCGARGSQEGSFHGPLMR